MNEKHFRELIREVIRKELEEMTVTGAVAGYETPNAFRGKSAKNKKRIKDIAERLGWKLTERGKEALNRKVDELVSEGTSKYYKFRNDQEKTARQKIGLSVRETKKALGQVNAQLKILSRYKNEFGYTADNYWKRTLKDIYRIEEKLVKISQKLRELKT
tara:strand:+ start:468 stop:944 length:477 start_codon:yes stop_codon:yes gene_type:complete